jgi:hypothetical protein
MKSFLGMKEWTDAMGLAATKESPQMVYLNIAQKP